MWNAFMCTVPLNSFSTPFPPLLPQVWSLLEETASFWHRCWELQSFILSQSCSDCSIIICFSSFFQNILGRLHTGLHLWFGNSRKSLCQRENRMVTVLHQGSYLWDDSSGFSYNECTLWKRSTQMHTGVCVCVKLYVAFPRLKCHHLLFCSLSEALFDYSR